MNQMNNFYFLFRYSVSFHLQDIEIVWSLFGRAGPLNDICRSIKEGCQSNSAGQRGPRILSGYSFLEIDRAALNYLLRMN